VWNVYRVWNVMHNLVEVPDCKKGISTYFKAMVRAKQRQSKQETTWEVPPLGLAAVQNLRGMERETRSSSIWPVRLLSLPRLLCFPTMELVLAARMRATNSL